MKGRKRKTKEQHELSGSYDHDPQRRRPDEPDAPEGWPVMPDHADFDDTAKAKWQGTCRLMESMGTISPAYGGLLERYAISYSHYRRVLKQASKTGLVLVTNKGLSVEVKRNPFTLEAHKYNEECTKAETELGLTPASKPRVAIEGAKKSDEDDFFEGPKIANMG